MVRNLLSRGSRSHSPSVAPSSSSASNATSNGITLTSMGAGKRGRRSTSNKIGLEKSNSSGSGSNNSFDENNSPPSPRRPSSDSTLQTIPSHDNSSQQRRRRGEDTPSVITEMTASTTGTGGTANNSLGLDGGTFDELRALLETLNGKSYSAYQEIETTAARTNRRWVHQGHGFSLLIGRVQADVATSPPTRCRIEIPESIAQLDASFLRTDVRRLAAADFLWRQFYAKCREMGADAPVKPGTQQPNGGEGGGSGNNGGSSNGSGSSKSIKGGDIHIMEPSQHVLEQTAVQVDRHGHVFVQFMVHLPAKGRHVLAVAAQAVLCHILVALVRDSLLPGGYNKKEMKKHVDSIEDQAWLQNELDRDQLVAFIKNGARFPRRSPSDDRPKPAAGVVMFESPASLEISFKLPNAGIKIKGMGIKRGVTLICGASFQGKSTLLQALQTGVYWKVPGDGREFCTCSPNAVKVRAEKGRCVKAVDISPFVNNLPFGLDTNYFSTFDASGGTSLASSIVESIEMGVDTLLLDEESCCAGFLGRDALMAELVDLEPLTPLSKVVRSLYHDRGVSTILAVGSAGEYVRVADHVLVMSNYKCEDATVRAKKLAARMEESGEGMGAPVPFGKIRERYPEKSMFAPNGKVRVKKAGAITYGDTQIDLSSLEQIVSSPQTIAIAEALKRFALSEWKEEEPLRVALEGLEQLIEEEGLDILAPGQFNGALCRPRIFEIGAAINRLRREGSIDQRVLY